MSDWGSRNRDREVVVTGAGVLCHFGDDLQTIESMLREGRNTPFTPYPPGVAMKSRCQIAGQYPGELTDADLGVTKSQGRFLGRQSRLALGAARRALAQSGLERRDVAVVVGLGRRRRGHARGDPEAARHPRRHPPRAADGGAAPDGVDRRRPTWSTCCRRPAPRSRPARPAPAAPTTCCWPPC